MSKYRATIVGHNFYVGGVDEIPEKQGFRGTVYVEADDEQAARKAALNKVESPQKTGSWSPYDLARNRGELDDRPIIKVESITEDDSIDLNNEPKDFCWISEEGD